MNITEIQSLLDKNGIKPSLHRIKILEYLLTHKTHPTADMLFRDIACNIPTLSKTTVYNTLKSLHNCGLIQAINIEDNEVRYDADISHHAHFKCIRCKSVYDVNVNYDALPAESIEDHSITEIHLYFRGTCRNCRRLPEQI